MRSAERSRSSREAIVATAVRLFGEGGIETTSLREIAKASDVSAALLVHHFGGKDGLVEAVDEAAVSAFAAAYASDVAVNGEDLLRRRADQTARVMRKRPDICAYIGRALVERTPGATRLFELLIAGGRREVEALAENGALRDDADPLWTTLQHFFLIWAPLSFMPLLEGTLAGTLLDEDELERWVEANVGLLKEGVYR